MVYVTYALFAAVNIYLVIRGEYCLAASVIVLSLCISVVHKPCPTIPPYKEQDDADNHSQR